MLLEEGETDFGYCITETFLAFCGPGNALWYVLVMVPLSVAR